jgi:hypothetical protein
MTYVHHVPKTADAAALSELLVERMPGDSVFPNVRARAA